MIQSSAFVGPIDFASFVIYKPLGTSSLAPLPSITDTCSKNIHEWVLVVLDTRRMLDVFTVDGFLYCLPLVSERSQKSWICPQLEMTLDAHNTDNAAKLEL